ncbi:unnamed protein product [Trichobilharzia szidati]|nr:unnamed protein product [Trichobilharzia szidati]
MDKEPLTPVPSEQLLGPGYGQGVWPLRERLALATALLDVDNQQGTWSSTSRRLMPFSKPGRPPTWCSPRACAKQYALLLDSIELVKRQNMPGSDSQSSQLSLAERVVKRLSAERAEELRSRIQREQKYYSSLKSIISNVESGMYDSQLPILLEQIKSFTESKNKPENVTPGKNTSQIDSPSKTATSAGDKTTNELERQPEVKCSDKGDSGNVSAESSPQGAENLLGLVREIQDFYRIPDSTWYCAPGPINSCKAFGSVTSRSRPSTASGPVKSSRVLDEASSSRRESVVGSRHSAKKSMNFKSGKHDSGHATAASRAAEATKQRYLSRANKSKFTHNFEKSNQNKKCRKQPNEHKNLSDNASHKYQYRNSIASTSASKANRVYGGVTRKSKLSGSMIPHQKQDSNMIRNTVFQKQEIANNSSDDDDDGDNKPDDESSLYEETSTDMQTDTPSSTPSTIAMYASDFEDFLVEEDDKSDNTVPIDDSATYCALDNDRQVTETIDENEAYLSNSEDDKCIASDVASSLSTEAVAEVECEASDKLSSVSPSPTIVNTTDVIDTVIEEDIESNETSQRSLVETAIESFVEVSPVAINHPQIESRKDFEGEEVSATDVNSPKVAAETEIFENTVTNAESSDTSTNLVPTDVEHESSKTGSDKPNTPDLTSRTSEPVADESGQLNNSSTEGGRKYRSLTLRLSRKGTQLVVVSSSESTPNCSSQDLNTSSIETSVDNTSSHDSDWRSWASQLLSSGERIVNTLMSKNERLVLSPRSKNQLSESQIKELIDELLDPVASDLNKGLVTSKLQFIHRLLHQIAETRMIRPSNTIRHRIAIELYEQWVQQLQIDVPEPSFTSTPNYSNVNTSLSWSNESGDNSLDASSNHPPTLTSITSSLDSSSSKLSSDIVVSCHCRCSCMLIFKHSPLCLFRYACWVMRVYN